MSANLPLLPVFLSRKVRRAVEVRDYSRGAYLAIRYTKESLSEGFGSSLLIHHQGSCTRSLLCSSEFISFSSSQIRFEEDVADVISAQANMSDGALITITMAVSMTLDLAVAWQLGASKT